MRLTNKKEKLNDEGKPKKHKDKCEELVMEIEKEMQNTKPKNIKDNKTETAKQEREREKER